MKKFCHAQTLELFESKFEPELNSSEKTVCLRSLMSSGRLGPSTAKDIVFQIIEELSYFHGIPLPHVMLTPDRIMITDTGLVNIEEKTAAQEVSRSRLKDDVLTESDFYMAPEIWNGGCMTVASDIYSVGALAYELLSTRIAFDGSTRMQVLAAHLDRERAVLNFDNEMEPFKEVLLKCLAVSPQDRYPDMQELALDLGRAFQLSSRKVTLADAGKRSFLRAGIVCSFLIASMVSFSVGLLLSSQGVGHLGNVASTESAFDSLASKENICQDLESWKAEFKEKSQGSDYHELFRLSKLIGDAYLKMAMTEASDPTGKRYLDSLVESVRFLSCSEEYLSCISDVHDRDEYSLLDSLATSYVLQGDSVTACEYAQRAFELTHSSKQFSADDKIQALCSLGQRLTATGKLDQGERRFRQALALDHETYKDGLGLYAFGTYLELINNLESRGLNREALAVCNDYMTREKRTGGPDATSLMADCQTRLRRKIALAAM